MIIKPHETLAEIVSRNIHAATVLNEYSLDFFSRGSRNLETACLEDHAPMSTVLEELWELNESGNPDVRNMTLTELSMYILKTHHRFAEKKVTFIKHTLARLVRECGDDVHVSQIQQAFTDLSLYLTVHMRHEELVIFPLIRKLARSTAMGRSMSPVQSAIISMEEDHNHEVESLRRLELLTDRYSTRRDADYALRITYDAMRELERDLKIHMHLENNVLFPAALRSLRDLSKEREAHLEEDGYY